MSTHSPDFLTFCRALGKSPDTALSELPPGAYGNWLKARWAEFDAERGTEAPHFRAWKECEEFTAWLAARFSEAL